MGDALAHAGRGAQSAEAYLNARAQRPKATRRRARCNAVAARQLLASGRFEAGVALTAELLGRVGCDYPDTATKRALAYAWTRSRITHARSALRARTEPANAAVAERLQTLSLFREMQACDLLGSAWLQGRFLLAALDAGDEEAILEGLTWECFHLSMQSGARHQRRAARGHERGRGTVAHARHARTRARNTRPRSPCSTCSRAVAIATRSRPPAKANRCCARTAQVTTGS